MNRYLLKAHQECDSPGAIAPTQAAASPERHLSVPAQVVLPRGPLSSDLRCLTQTVLPTTCTAIHTQSLKPETWKPTTSPSSLASSPHLTLGAGGVPCRGAGVAGSAPSAWGNSFSESQWEAVGRLPRTTSCPHQGTKSLPFLGLSLHICITGTNPCRVNLLCYLG